MASYTTQQNSEKKSQDQVGENIHAWQYSRPKCHECKVETERTQNMNQLQNFRKKSKRKYSEQQMQR